MELVCVDVVAVLVGDDSLSALGELLPVLFDDSLFVLDDLLFVFEDVLSFEEDAEEPLSPGL